MKVYKNYEKRFIGSSDIGSLVYRSWNSVGLIEFGGDGEYFAYIVDEDAEIGEHYQKVVSATHWLDLYDDTSRTMRFSGAKINIYRAGGFGIIIQVIQHQF